MMRGGCQCAQLADRFKWSGGQALPDSNVNSGTAASAGAGACETTRSGRACRQVNANRLYQAIADEHICCDLAVGVYDCAPLRPARSLASISWLHHFPGGRAELLGQAHLDEQRLRTATRGRAQQATGKQRHNVHLLSVVPSFTRTLAFQARQQDASPFDEPHPFSLDDCRTLSRWGVLNGPGSSAVLRGLR